MSPVTASGGKPRIDAAAAAGKNCVFCLHNQKLRASQVLLAGERFYLCAPHGQMVEGYLVIAPYECIGALSRLPGDYLPELARFRSVVRAFYQEAYGVAPGLCYEQGRAGGGTLVDVAGGFPHHAHLCSLPLDVNLHACLEDDYIRRDVAGLHELVKATSGSPYLYVECRDGRGGYQPSIYVSDSAAGRRELERSRLKPIIARLAGVPDRGDWRRYPGEAELERLIDRFGRWRSQWQMLSRQHAD